MSEKQLAKVENQIGISRQSFQTNDMIDVAWRMASYAASSSLTKVKNKFDAFFIIQYGWELGLTPMASLRTIYVVNGTPTCSGEAMLALIRRSGLCTKLEIKGDDKQATVKMERSNSDTYTATFTIDDANRAGLTGKQVWKHYPAKMLKWRAVSECAKFLFGDIIGGLYTVEEIAPASDLNEAGELIGDIVITDDNPKQSPPAKEDDDVVIDGEFSDTAGDETEDDTDPQEKVTPPNVTQGDFNKPTHEKHLQRRRANVIAHFNERFSPTETMKKATEAGVDWEAMDSDTIIETMEAAFDRVQKRDMRPFVSEYTKVFDTLAEALHDCSEVVYADDLQQAIEKVAIVGSRDYPHKQHVIDYVQSLPPETVIISGGARGVDTWAEQAAREQGMQTIIYPAEWDKYGKSAGFRRNADIVSEADKVVAFHHNASKGTAHTINLAIQENKLEAVFTS